MDRFLVCCGLGGTLISIGLIDRVYETNDSLLLDSPKIILRYFCGFFLIFLFFGSAQMQVISIIYWLIAVCFLQIIFENFISPVLSSSEEDSFAIPFIPEVSDKSSKKYSFDKVVQKGTPGNYKRGIYAYLIDGTWNRLIIIYICTFVFINIFFAMIYNSSPKSVGGLEGNSFMEMFYFSVETMSTIGYGQKYPESGFGNFVVTLEALVGILLVRS